MRRLFSLAAFALALPLAPSQPPISYPLAHYFASADGASLAAWQKEIRAFRKSLRREMPDPERPAELLHAGREKELLASADPRNGIVRDPLRILQPPKVLSWIEVIETDGRVSQVHVVSSNGTKESDRAAIMSSLAQKRWRPATSGGKAVRSFRSANVTLGDSPFLVSTWMKRIPEEAGVLIAVVVAAVLVLALLRLTRKKELKIEN